MILNDLIHKANDMTKAEERALEAYPVLEVCSHANGPYDTFSKLDVNKERRNCYQQGYEQAENDIKDALLEYLQKNVDYYAEGGETGHIMSLTYKDVLRKVQSL